MTDDDTPSDAVSRRPYLKMLGAGLAASLAGCGSGGPAATTEEDGDGAAGDGGDGGDTPMDGGDTPMNGGDGGETPTETDTTGTESMDISGMSFSYWSVDWSQSNTAEQFVDDTVSQFEEETGATVDLRKAANPAGNQQVWVQAVNNNDWPHIFEAGANVGTMVELGIVKPASTYLDFFSDDFREQFEPWLDLAAEQNRGFAGRQKEVYVPLWGDARSPMVTRRSFFEETPGLDPDEDFPPSSFEEFVETARTLQEDGPVDFGTIVFGGGGDILDNHLPILAYQEGGVENGALYTSDWQDVNLDTDAWKRAFSKYVGLFTEEGLAPPESPSAGDEQVGALLRQGRIGMAWNELFTFPQIREQVPDIIDDMMYAPMWGSEDYPDAIAKANTSGICFTEAPPNEDADEWEQAQRAAARYIESTYGSQEGQVRGSQDYGRVPLREDVREEVRANAEETNNIIMPTMFEILDTLRDTGYVFQNHPRNIAVTYTDAPPLLQEAFSGDVSPEQACENAAEAARQRL